MPNTKIDRKKLYILLGTLAIIIVIIVVAWQTNTKSTNKVNSSVPVSGIITSRPTPPPAPDPTYFAQVIDGKVTNVIVATPEFIVDFSKGTPGEWIQSDPNTRGGLHYNANTNQPDGKPALRKNSAGVGYTYNKELDAFIPPKSFESWKLNQETGLWEAPVAQPTDGKIYQWDEQTQSWVEGPAGMELK